MINRKIRFVWDLGGGPAEVTHHLHIQTAGDLQKDQHWYKIDAERYCNFFVQIYELGEIVNTFCVD